MLDFFLAREQQLDIINGTIRTVLYRKFETIRNDPDKFYKNVFVFMAGFAGDHGSSGREASVPKAQETTKKKKQWRSASVTHTPRHQISHAVRAGLS